LPDVVGGIARVDIHAHDHLTAGSRDHDVHGGRLDPSWILEDADSTRVALGDLTQDLQGPVRAHPVAHEHLESVGRIVLREDVVEAGGDVALLVEAGDRDRHEGRTHRGRR
jgi:hypothetical protein